MRNLELVSIAWLVVLLPLAIANKTPGHPKEDCIRKCCNVGIDYPFGISRDCYLNEAFEVSCINDVLTLAKSDIEHKFIISAIRFPDQVLLLSNQIMAWDCNNTGIDTDKRQSNVSIVLGEPLRVSSRANRFRAFGCDTKAFIVNNDSRFGSQCDTQWIINSSGAMKHGMMGGCQIALPFNSSRYGYSVTDMFDYTETACRTNCSYAVLAEEGYNTSNEVLNRFLNKQIPLVAEWAIQDGHCNEIGRSFTCGQNARCNHTASESGYHCYCNSDGKGNPYLNGPDGCQTGGGLAVDKPKMKKLILGAVAGVAVFFLTCSFFICLSRKLPSDSSIFFWRKKTHDSRNVEAFLENYSSIVPKRYRYSELKKMTNSFEDNLGQGGYGSVFKGKVDDGRLVAVKVLNNSKGSKGAEFINEVASVGRTNHVNVVSLLGFCSEGSRRALVYEFMSKGSLEKFIFFDKPGTGHALDCQKLFKIAVGIARGLEYLHRGCNTRIVHFDIKPHNILLDDDFCPKISDFGLAKLCPQQQSTLSMLDARGTIGYTAPEVFCRNIGGVSHKSDVYSYGMMVLEMIGGRKNIDAKAENTSEIYFPHWVYKHIELKESLRLLGFRTEAEEEIGRKMVLVGLWCIQTDPTSRPSMSRVLEMLEGSLGSLEMPPKPYLSSPSRSCSSTT